MVNLSRYKVEDDERDEILLFRQFDPKAPSAQAGDIAGAYQMMEQDLRSVPPRSRGENSGGRHRLVSQPQGWRAGAERAMRSTTSFIRPEYVARSSSGWATS